MTTTSIPTRTARLTRRLRRVATVALVIGGLASVAAPAQAQINTNYGGGTGSMSVTCSTSRHHIDVTVLQQQQAGALGQTMMADIYLYNYATGRQYLVFSGYPNQVAMSGLGYTWYSTAIASGHYAVRVAYFWYTTAGWISGTEWAPVYTQQTPYYAYGGGYGSYSCFA